MKTKSTLISISVIFSLLLSFGTFTYVKADPGYVTVSGTIYYKDRDNSIKSASYVTVELYDADSNGQDEILTDPIKTDINGDFQFPGVFNWDDDDVNDPNYNLDPYIKVKTETEDTANVFRKVMSTSGEIYHWKSVAMRNVNDGPLTIFYTIQEDATYQAMWIFQDLRRAWAYVINNTSPLIDPGSVTAIWEKNVNDYSPCSGSCFLAGTGIFINDGYVNSQDTIVHETGHNYMFNKTGWWLYWDIPCFNHNIFSVEDIYCSWSEGWADFLPILVNGDTCYDLNSGHCSGIPDIYSFNLETHDRSDDPQYFPWGDFVEGRIAGALYDLVDPNDDGYDTASFGFGPVANVALINNAVTNDTFVQFWNNWGYSGQSFHQGVRAIYQNTIDLDYPPTIGGIPDLTVLQNLGASQILDLWMFSSDVESNYEELDYYVKNVSDANCGVSIQDGWVNISPTHGWLGSCEVTVEVNDSIKTDDDTFWIEVVPATGWNYVPLMMQP